MQGKKRLVGWLTRFLAAELCCLLGTPAHPQSAAPAPAQAQTPAAARRYANMPEEAVPYRKFTKPYKEWYLTEDTLEYNGAARERMPGGMAEAETVNIGLLGPVGNNPEEIYGRAMRNGAQLAIEQANGKGGYRAPGATSGKMYELKVHNDAAQWGASSTEAVKMLFDEHVVAVLGSVDGASTHIMLRVALKLEFPIVDTATTDPTVTETRIPWLIHNFPDDRQQGYALAEAVFNERKLKRIGVIRTQSRYARVGAQKFVDEAKRLGHVPVLEVKFERGDKDFAAQMRLLQNAHVDAVVIWGEVPEAALILKQMRAMGMQQPVFGPSRLCYPEIIESAGPASEGLTTTVALDPTRADAKWQEFRREYRAKFNEEPDAYAAYAYDGMNLLVRALEKAGLNRGRVMDAFREYQTQEYRGVAGVAHFDYTLNNIAPVGTARVEGGRFVYAASGRQGRIAEESAGEP